MYQNLSLVAYCLANFFIEQISNTIGIGLFTKSCSYEDVLKMYSESGEAEEINDISNLTLLDAGTNRGYKNAIFPIKRKKIIQKDQNGTFIPLCTKNAFLKYYNDSVDQTTLWGKADKESYLKAILNTLKEFLPEQNTNQIN